MPRHIPLAEIFTILKSGNFILLIGGLEDAQLECKGAPYRLTDDFEKMEFAKDISALANADGGVILLGVTTEEDMTFRGDAIRSFGCFKREVVDFEQYQKVALDWIIPPIRGLTFDWHPDVNDISKGVASIVVPSGANSDRPYIVSRAVDSTRVAGSYVGYFERTRDSVSPMRAGEIRARLKDGLRFSELNPRIANIEAMIANLAVPIAKPEPSLDFERDLFPRVQASRRAFNSETIPTFSLAAWPVEPVEFSGLFRSNTDPVVQLLENPPSLRGAGFNISTNRASTTIEGKLRRSLAPEFRLLEVWRDGFLLCIVQGDGGHLCWGTAKTGFPDMQINNISLTETVYLFCDWALKTYEHAEPKPARIRIRGMLANMNHSGHSFALSNCVLNRFSFGTKGRAAPNPEGFHFTTEADRNTPIGVVAYNLLADFYVWFGFNSDEMPYADRSVTPPRIDLAQLTLTG